MDKALNIMIMVKSCTRGVLKMESIMEKEFLILTMGKLSIKVILLDINELGMN